MKRQVFKYLVVAAIAVMLTSCFETKIVEPCELDGTGTLKLINKTALRFTIKIDGVNYGQINARDVKQYVLMEGENYVCVELSNAICYKDFTVDIIPCKVVTKEINN